MAKRSRTATTDADIRTPKRARLQDLSNEQPVVNGKEVVNGTPKSALRKSSQQTPKHVRHAEDVSEQKDTPVKSTEKATTSVITSAVRNDRSAHKKSALTIQQRAAEIDSDNEADQAVAEAILNDNEAESPSEDETPADNLQTDSAQPQAEPVKRGRGRPKGSKKQRTPTPPPDIPAHELYFFQNRTTAAKTSSNTLPAHVLLNHEDYLAQIKTVVDTHLPDIQRLKVLHRRAFEQWHFELDEGFSICLYGFGSKRDLLSQFAEHIYDNVAEKGSILMVNGYTYGITIRDILMSLSAMIFDRHAQLPTQASSLLDTILAGIEEDKRKKFYILINELDSTNLRKSATQALLAKLASHRKVCLVCTCDNPNFGLLWDLSLITQYNFAFHDGTTFDSWSVELDAVEDVNTLLGRSSRRLAGKDGVGFVLKSLPENARNLFKMLVTEQLAAGINTNAMPEMDDDDAVLGASDEERAAQAETPSRRGRGRPPKKSVAKTIKSKLSTSTEGVEYRSLYHKAVEAFICSSEVSFRTLLKEFHDHSMIESKKDAMGTERLVVPFRKEDLEAILEEL